MLVARLITNNLNRIRKISSLSSSTTTTTTTLIHHNYNFQFDDDSSARNVVNGSFMFQRRWHTGDSHSHHDLRSGKDGERIFRLGLAADIGLAASKAFTGYVSGSTAIIADAAHSVSDVVLSGVALLSFKAAMVPKDKEHPYGHGKFETLGALGISGVLLATAGGIGWHALDVLLGLWSAAPEVVNQSHLHLHEQHHSGHHHGIDMDHPVFALNVTILSIAVKEALCAAFIISCWSHRWIKGSLVYYLYGLGQSSPHELAFEVELGPRSISLSVKDLLETVSLPPRGSGKSATCVFKTSRIPLRPHCPVHQMLAGIIFYLSLLYWITKRAGERVGSGLMKANAWHHRADAVSSVVALIGVGALMLQCGGVTLAMDGFKRGRGRPNKYWREVIRHDMEQLQLTEEMTLDGKVWRTRNRVEGWGVRVRRVLELVDAAIPSNTLEPFKRTILQVDGGCSHLRGRRAGSYLYLDVIVEVDPFSSVSAAHEIGENVSREIQRLHPEIAEVFVHIEPSTIHIPPTAEFQQQSTNIMGDTEKHSSLEHADIENTVCSILSTSFPQKMIVERVTPHLLQGQVLLQVEVSMPPDLLIRDAVKVAEEAEKLIMEAAPNIVHVCIQLRLGQPMPESYHELVESRNRETDN
ncbi:Metal tolerance protein C1 [Capsicum annuum]|nr:Metal tolerance protein C1 [Capsicum annuum]